MAALTPTDELRSMLVDLRHRLHRRPEVGLDLPHTHRAVLDALQGLPLEVVTGETCTSVTAVLRGGRRQAVAANGPALGPPRTEPPAPSRVVLLRADMDALPVHEEVDLAWRSTVEGVMHACGHDLHTTMLVGAAHLLARQQDQLIGDVVFMFQPGEEGYEGASQMIAEGVLEAAGSRADAAYALHVQSGLVSGGSVASRCGPLMAASDSLSVTVQGRGGHGATPHLNRDPIAAACEMVLSLYAQLSRHVSPFEQAVVSIGRIYGGTRRNIIPDGARFEASIRTFDPLVRESIAGSSQSRV